MFSKIFNLSNLTLLTALSLSTVAAYYSIYGLTAIFAGAVIPIIIMGGILEVGKIVTTVWLRKYWHRCGLLLKMYLVPAVVLLAILTSMGIFGFLSKAHTDQNLVSGDVQAQLSIFDEKIKTSKENIDANRKALKQLDEAVDQVMGRSTTEAGADKAVAIRRGQQAERRRLLNEIEAEQKKITKLNEEAAPIRAQVRQVEAEVGPVKYIAALIYGDNPDANLLERAVRWVIILLVIVFDPLAIALVLAANASKDWDKEKKEEEPTYEPDEGPLTEEQIEQVKIHIHKPMMFVDPGEHPKDKDIKTIDEEKLNCYKCGTELINAPGIGPFCPNKNCDILDNTKGIDWTFEKPEPEKPLLEKYPYLNNGFQGYPDLKPMVSPKEEVKANVPTVDSTQTIVEVQNTNSMPVKQDLPFEELPGGYVSFDGKHMSKDALFSMHPEFLKLSADASKPVNSGFGSKFPDDANKGDVFTRVDVLPNKVFKFDGKTWIEINKNLSNTYLYNTKYLEYLIEMIDNGQYDPELLSENEKAQIEDYLKIQKISKKD
jgi:hypothetical protein